MLERMRQRSLTPLPDKSSKSENSSEKSDSPEELTTEEKIEAEQKEINKASATLRKMKMRLLGRKAEENLSEFGKPAFHKPVKIPEIENIPSDDDNQSEFSVATTVVVEKGLNRLVNQ